MTLLKISFAAGLVSWLVLTDRFRLSELTTFLQPNHLIVGFSLLGVHLFIVSERWRFLLTTQGHMLKRIQSWRLTLKGLFFNFAVPGGVGGDVMKAFYLQKDSGVSRAIAYSSVLIDRVIGLYTFVILALIGILIEMQQLPNQISILSNLLLWVGLIFLALSSGFIFIAKVPIPDRFKDDLGIKGKIFRFSAACSLYVKQPSTLIKSIGYTVAAQMITLYFFSWFLNDIMLEPVSWPTLFFIVPLGFMLMAIPLTPAGVGVGQAAFYFLFHTFSNKTIQSGSAVITAFQLLLFVWGLVGAFYYLTRKNELPSQIDPFHAQN